ncbi:hypothetical protein ACFL47_08400 [Candidatus Latescibacterota bacterium]
MRRRSALKFLTAFSSYYAAIPHSSWGTLNSGESLPHRYLGNVKRTLEKIRSTELDNLLEASHRIATTVKSGGTCYSSWDVGHSLNEDMFEGRHGDPGLFTFGYPEDTAKSGDLLLGSLVGELKGDPRDKGVFVIGGPAPWCAETIDADKLLSDAHKRRQIRKYSDLWIDTYCPTHGSYIWLPGAQYPAGAVSSVLGMITFWMMTADAVRILAKDGVKVTVKGDGPDLGSNVVYESLHSPLAEKYLAEAIEQINRIEAEMGTVNAIAEIAVDTILSGGRVHVYSKYWAALSIEANTRMGGLTVFHSVDSDTHKEYHGTDKDFVIMGIYQPEDSVDLNYLEIFRRAGSTVASIGPATRDGKYPSGKTVPTETDYHIGHMCDTYGLFALPGIQKKVCPISGILVNQIFYAVCMRMTEFFIERTGNTPYFYPNGALEGPPYHEFSRVHNAGRKRGY